jgi:hypothetical protein
MSLFLSLRKRRPGPDGQGARPFFGLLCVGFGVDQTSTSRGGEAELFGSSAFDWY